MTRIVAHASVLFIFIRFSWAAAPWPALAQRPGPRPCPQDAAPASPEPIGKIRVDEMLQPVVSMLLAKSETFRRQWQIINASRFIRVTVVWRFGLQETHSARARTEVTHYEYGSIRAIIEVPAGTDLTELLPHELEHVIEQLEGLDLAALARQHGEGVVEVRKGIYESARARAAGLQVYREVYGETDPAVRPRLAGSGGPGRRQTPANRRRSSARATRRGQPDTFISVGNRIRCIIVFAYSSRVDHTPSVPVRLNDRIVPLRVPLGVVRRAFCG